MLLLASVGWAQDQQQNSFQTPSGNIFCQATGGAGALARLDCELMVNNAKIPPKPKDCPLEYGNRFSMLARGKPQRLCHIDTLMDKSMNVLAYGQVWRFVGFTCEVSRVRLRCVNLERRGFELARAAQRLF